MIFFSHRGYFFLYFLTPLLFFLSFPPFRTSYLAYIALIPFFILLETREYRSGFRHGYVTGLLAVGIFLHWINFNSGASQVQAMGMYMSMVLYLALWWGLFAVLMNLSVRRFGQAGLFAAPFLWTALEYGQSFGELGFPWHSLATTQTAYPYFIQFIQYTGMYGITWWVVGLNVLIYLTVKEVFNATPDPKFPGKKFLIAALTLVFFIPVIHGTVTYNQDKGPAGKQVSLAIIQPNIEPNRKWLERDFAFRKLMDMTRSLRDGHKDLIIWPETAFPSRLRIDPYKKNIILDELRLQKTRLLTGIPDKKAYQEENGDISSRYFNSVFLISPDSVFESYDKIHLVPLGEYVPDFLFLIRDFAMDVGASNYAEGEGITVFRLPLRGGDSLLLSSVICYESVFSGLVRSFVIKDAEMIVIVTNDAWYDDTMAPEQHAHIAVLRAIEHGIPVVRCANSGVSCIISPKGKILHSAPNPSESIIRETVMIHQAGTFFTLYGDWFPWMNVAVSSGIGIMILIMSVSGMRAGKS